MRELSIERIQEHKNRAHTKKGKKRLPNNKRTFTPASLHTSHEGTSLLRNQLRKSRNDLTPKFTKPSGVQLSHLSCASSEIVFSLRDIEKFLKAGGVTWDWDPGSPSWQIKTVIVKQCTRILYNRILKYVKKQIFANIDRITRSWKLLSFLFSTLPTIETFGKSKALQPNREEL